MGVAALGVEGHGVSRLEALGDKSTCSGRQSSPMRTEAAEIGFPTIRWPITIITNRAGLEALEARH